MSLREKLKDIPNSPGVYLFYANNKIVYIGKSNNLKSRIRSYFSNHHSRRKIYIMMDFVNDLKIIKCDTHLEARLLEYELIRKHYPIYNSQFKNKKNLCYLEIDKDKMLKISDNGFGPLIKSRNIDNFIENMKYIFPISCDGENFIFKKNLFPKNLNNEEKSKTYESLNLIFKENYFEIFRNNLKTEMIKLSENLNFEDAIFFKNLIREFEILFINYFKKIDFHNNSHVFYSDDKDYFIMTYKGNIIAKDKTINLENYKNINLDEIKENNDEEYKNIIFSEYISSK
ncbi:GIY-YIG nuclease family protein [Peptoniphilus sp. MSJ-1]|uniref:GIY-YIG nuclease family protein n=1 Tax=Peptoniphilus ovalis TaxID=2841503 RepID=A0ABS6FGR1_9FIRM|nr:GIY-YIG nuclease family protein [Peptoniphilus ovalis]MBU5669365.1 GIY-YIG nuclease family protein [Peptoniphilus ovalis]